MSKEPSTSPQNLIVDDALLHEACNQLEILANLNHLCSMDAGNEAAIRRYVSAALTPIQQLGTLLHDMRKRRYWNQ